jgi:hypothetical protein
MEAEHLVQSVSYDVPFAGPLDQLSPDETENHVLFQPATDTTQFPLTCCLVSNLFRLFKLPVPESLPIQPHRPIVLTFAPCNPLMSYSDWVTPQPCGGALFLDPRSELAFARHNVLSTACRSTSDLYV